MKRAILVSCLAVWLFGCSSSSDDSAASDDSGLSIGPGGDAGPDATLLSEAGTDGATGDGHAEAGLDATTPDGALDGASTTDASDGAAGASLCSTALLGPAGGTITHPSGAKIIVPVSALAAATHLSLCAAATPASVGGVVIGPAFVAGPAGQTFLAPVEIVLPFDATRVAVGSSLDAIQVQMAASGSSSFEATTSTVDLAAGTVHASTIQLAQFVPVVTPSPILIESNPSAAYATVGVEYMQGFIVFGGVPPYTWSLIDPPTPPAGLTLLAGSGVTWTPTAPGDYTFGLEITDSANDQATWYEYVSVAPATNPAPSVTSLTPSSVLQGSADTVISVFGGGFEPASQVLWDGSPLPTTYIDYADLAATIPASDLLVAGAHSATVSTPAPGGGVSGPVTFTVTTVASLDPAPSITSVSPTTLPLSTSSAPITVTGTGFVATSSVVIGTQPIATSYVSATQMTGTIPAAYLSSAGTLQIGVSNPSPGGGLSPTEVTLTVGPLNPAPTLTTVAPSSAVAGSADFTIDLTGNSFVQGAETFFGGTAVATTFSSATSLEAIVPATLLASAGTVQVVVVNPTPGGGASGAVAFTIDPAADYGMLEDGGCTGAVPEDAGDCTATPPSTAKVVCGRCLTTLASGQTGLMGIVVNETGVYWSGGFNCTGGTVMRVPLGGGPAVTIAANQSSPGALASDSVNLYWANYCGDGGVVGTGGIVTIPLATAGDGGVPTTLVPDQQPSSAISVEQDSLFWTDSQSGKVMRVNTDGGALTTLASRAPAGDFSPFNIATDPTSVYWAEYPADGGDAPAGGNSPYLLDDSILRLDLDSGAITTVATGQNYPFSFSVSATTLYWSNYNPPSFVTALPLPSGPAAILASLPDQAMGTAIDGANLYVATENGIPAGARVRRVPLQGGSPVTTLVALPPGSTPTPLVVDATSVYWVDQISGTVMKLTPK